MKRNPDKKAAKIILGSVSAGTAVFASGNAIATAAIPNPVTLVAAGVSGAISAITGAIAASI